MSIHAATISLDEIVPGATARITVINGVQYLSLRDVIMHVCDLSPKRANEKWDRLSEDIKQELTAFCGQCRFSGPGNPCPVPVITFKGVLKLVMLVSGQRAALYRSTMSRILQRYYAGDGSLTEEIQVNAWSTAPVQQMARASLAVDSAVMQESMQALARKRRLEELEIEKLELELSIKKREADLEYALKITSSYRDLCQDSVMDPRAKSMFKDYYLNMVKPGVLGEQPSDSDCPPSSCKPISLSQVAAQMGLKITTSELISLGGKLRKCYENKHGQPPSKHEQLCDGRITMVNSYMESDRPMVEELLREWSQSQKKATVHPESKKVQQAKLWRWKRDPAFASNELG